MSDLASYEWDDAKRAKNRAKHGVDFADVVRFHWASALLIDDRRHDEPRVRALGLIDGKLMALVYTERGARVRVISLRKAEKQERRLYERS